MAGAVRGMPSILVRESAPRDLQTIKEICEKTEEWQIPFFLWKAIHQRKLRRVELLVAEVNGRVVGVAFAFKKLVVGFVALLAVHPEYQRRGIGSTLLKEVCERLRKKTVRLVVLLITDRQKISELSKFYKRHGFKVLGMICIKTME